MKKIGKIGATYKPPCCLSATTAYCPQCGEAIATLDLLAMALTFHLRRQAVDMRRKTAREMPKRKSDWRRAKMAWADKWDAWADWMETMVTKLAWRRSPPDVSTLLENAGVAECCRNATTPWCPTCGKQVFNPLAMALAEHCRNRANWCRRTATIARGASGRAKKISAKDYIAKMAAAARKWDAWAKMVEGYAGIVKVDPKEQTDESELDAAIADVQNGLDETTEEMRRAISLLEESAQKEQPCSPEQNT